MSGIIDTHAHYDDDRFDEDRRELLLSLKAKGVDLVVNASASIDECLKTIELTKEYDFMYGMIGIHPDEANTLNDETFSHVSSVARDNSIHNGGKIVAIGEIGLDYYTPEPGMDLLCAKGIQIEWFRRQLELARNLKLPVNIHSRDAAQDTLAVLKECHAESIGGIIHCYSYSVEMAREYEKLGFSFGIGGVVTFKNARKLVEVVEYLPIDRIVLETDAPYLAPTPFRGERNDSSYIHYVAEKIAELKGITKEEVIEQTSLNAKKIYGIGDTECR